ncbi:hypothetical protein ANCCAN_23638 [Ancylostoma caninum]|uniref:Uncharacterized protein n=1 Tax=Ancylostoma caninum TaxID=29170 RepID=A0A368FK95_ANCCA|nr:hypothetical protein ANCCAN_23638 [Ancylostoma caninum]
MPVSKGIGYRIPVSGNIHYDTEDISITYGQNLHPIDPLAFAPDRPLTRARRSIDALLVNTYSLVTSTFGGNISYFPGNPDKFKL